MPRETIVDAGPIYALFDRNDSYHEKAVEFIQRRIGDWYTTVPVLTEVIYLLDSKLQLEIDFIHWVAKGSVRIVELSVEDYRQTAAMMQKYSDRPADFADATLVAVADRLGIRNVASVDGDFNIYRYRRKYPFHNAFLSGA